MWANFLHCFSLPLLSTSSSFSHYIYWGGKGDKHTCARVHTHARVRTHTHASCWFYFYQKLGLQQYLKAFPSFKKYSCPLMSSVHWYSLLFPTKVNFEIQEKTYLKIIFLKNQCGKQFISEKLRHWGQIESWVKILNWVHTRNSASIDSQMLLVFLHISISFAIVICLLSF